MPNPPIHDPDAIVPTPFSATISETIQTLLRAAMEQPTAGAIAGAPTARITTEWPTASMIADIVRAMPTWIESIIDAMPVRSQDFSRIGRRSMSDDVPHTPINPHWPFATPQYEDQLDEAVTYAAQQASLLTERSTSMQKITPRFSSSRFFAHPSGRFTSGCIVLEINNTPVPGEHSAFRHFDDRVEGDRWTIPEAGDRVRLGIWVEVTGKYANIVEPPALFNLSRGSQYRSMSMLGPTDMHQGIGTPLYPSEADRNPILFPPIDFDRKNRADRFHRAWNYHHHRMQHNINSGNWRGHLRWYAFSKSEIMEAIRINRETADERRQWLKFPNRSSKDPKAAFKAWYERITKTPLDGGSLPGWIHCMRHKHSGLSLVMNTIDIANAKLGYGEWSKPDFALGNNDWYKEIPYHFVHTSKKDPSKIAYAKDWRALHSLTEADVTDTTNAFTVTSPGKYLKKYFGDKLTDDQIRDISTETIAAALPPVLHIARTEEEIIKAIAEGPTESCMANGYHGGRQDYGWFNSPMHPAAAYAGSGDFEVLYVIKGGEITARGIANARTKKVARIYGDSVKLQAAMTPAGYEQETRALVGCRLRKIVFGDEESRVVVPYVDAGIGSGGGSLYADFFNDGEGEWLRTCTSDGDVNTYDGYNNRGYAYIYGENGGKTCGCCGNRTDPDDLTYIDTDEISVCQSCYDDEYCYGVIDRNGEHGNMRTGDSVYCRSNDERYCADVAEYFDVYQVTIGSRAFRNKHYHQDYLVNIDGEWAHASDCTELDSQWYDDGDEWVLDHNAIETYDGCIIHTDDAAECAVTGRTYHYKQLIKIKTFGIDGKFYDVHWICLDAFTDAPERFSVLYRVPLMKPYLMFDSKVGTPIDQINWEDMAEPMEFDNVSFNGDSIDASDLHEALGEAYENADHPEEEEERIAA